MVHADADAGVADAEMEQGLGGAVAEPLRGGECHPLEREAARGLAFPVEEAAELQGKPPAVCVKAGLGRPVHKGGEDVLLSGEPDGSAAWALCR